MKTTIRTLVKNRLYYMEIQQKFECILIEPHVTSSWKRGCCRNRFGLCEQKRFACWHVTVYSSR